MAVTISDEAAIRRLLAAANNSVEYEDMSGSMVAITGSATDVDTSEQLEMFEAFQKVFIVNGENMKIADFINTKLSTADIRPDDVNNIAPLKGTILTGQTSDATMVVDYCDATNGAALVYGYTLKGAFDEAAEVVTGTNATGTVTAVSFTLNALPTEASTMPHWYDWTPMNNDTSTYGTLPGYTDENGDVIPKCYLGCLYRGRLVLSGNPAYPHQWYMSRQANPFDWTYLANDSQTPVAGTNADAGELGDIVRALIPYKDDYLIFGCAATIWVMRGDPAAGGSLDEISLTTGMFGSRSFCWDGSDNLYFFGAGGIYKIPPDFGPPVNISAITLPSLIGDEAADPTTHRISMGFDRDRHGIVIAVTKLADGTNSNYWYDLRTGGFFPETYPEECGVYAMHYYAANDPDFKGLLLGCKDGYIREFNDAAKDDDVGASDQAIDSHVSLGPVPMSPDPDSEGKLTSLTIVTGEDTDSIGYELYRDDTAESLIDDMAAETNQFITGTISAPGRVQRLRHRVRGLFLGVRCEAAASTTTWNIEKIVGEIKPAGSK